LRERGLRLVQWSDTGYDWKLRREGIVQAALKGLRPGAIVLLHDGRETRPPDEVDQSQTVEALPAFINGAVKLGYTFVRIEEFFESQPSKP